MRRAVVGLALLGALQATGCVDSPSAPRPGLLTFRAARVVSGSTAASIEPGVGRVHVRGVFNGAADAGLRALVVRPSLDGFWLEVINGAPTPGAVVYQYEADLELPPGATYDVAVLHRYALAAEPDTVARATVRLGPAP